MSSFNDFSDDAMSNQQEPSTGTAAVDDLARLFGKDEGGAKLSAFFADVAGRLQKAVLRRFRDQGLAEDAAQSAIRTFFRRLHLDHKYQFNSPSDVTCLLVVIAFHKAARQHRRQLPTIPLRAHFLEKALVYDEEATPESRAWELEAEEHLQAERQNHLDEMKAHMHRLLKPRNYQIFDYYFRCVYEGEKIERQEIARAAKCSVRTVQRVWKEIEYHWLPMLEEAKRALATFANS